MQEHHKNYNVYIENIDKELLENQVKTLCKLEASLGETEGVYHYAHDHLNGVINLCSHILIKIGEQNG